MEIKNSASILKYLQITLLSYSRLCYFTSIKDEIRKVKVRFQQVSSKAVKMKLEGIPKGMDGFLVFFSYTFIFRFRTKLVQGSEKGVYFCEFPEKIETFDRRKYARLKFESRENMVVTVYNKSLNNSSRGLLTDISAGGIGFLIVDTENLPKPGDLIMTEVKLKDKRFQVMAQVEQVRKDQVGCSFMEKSKKFQLELNDMVKTEVAWRSEHMLKNLRKREEMLQNLHKAQAAKEKEIQDITDRLGCLDPFIEHFLADFQAVTGLVLTLESSEYKENAALSDLQSLAIDILFYEEGLFKGFFSGQQDQLHLLAKPVFGDRLAGRAVNAEIILEELGKNLQKFTSSSKLGLHVFNFRNPKVVEVNKRLLSNLLRQPCFRLNFSSSAGEFNLVLLAKDIEAALDICDQARSREFITMEKMDLIEPISYSTLKVFSDLLKLDIREKSISLRERLLPRFEISVLLDIFFDDIDGKVILNMSQKLALKIYEILLNESVEEFNENVKDAIAELTNMITGNAKSQFEQQGLYYRISTPTVLKSRENVIIYARNMKFLSSVYWTSEGFFDLSFSFFKK